MTYAPMPPENILAGLRSGMVIPAHPLALTEERKIDEKHQRALTRYYCAAGAGGIAVGVHTTQFDIRKPEIGLLEPVLTLSAEEVAKYRSYSGRELVLVAGICGDTIQAIAEAKLASKLGYHTGLLSLSSFNYASNEELIHHCESVAQIIPLFGFYLQPAVGGRILDYHFWRRFCEIENVVGIKVAPFNRYQTIDVARAVAVSNRAHEIALYTGNDDNILLDLLTPYKFYTKNGHVTVRIVGGLLGQWAVWTKKAVEILDRIHKLLKRNEPPSPELLALSVNLTDANAAIFDAANNYAGCIPGIHEVLRYQGLLSGRWCLDPNEVLSPGQADEIRRIYTAYPHLNDDTFVSEHLDQWLS